MTEIELCADADSPFLVANLKLATALGVHRVELCADMARQGLTPSLATVNAARDAFPHGELLVMGRPHDRGFSYTAEELAEMVSSISMAAGCGADGVVFGVLDNTGALDMQANRTLVDAARSLNLKTTFHRAFDATSFPSEALSQVLTLDIDRVLSSGTDWDSSKGAVDGIERLQHFLQHAENQVELVIGGGVTPNNATTLINALTAKMQESQIGRKAPFSLHCFSSLLSNGQLDAEKVSCLMQGCRTV